MVLIVEDDLNFAQFELDMARERGMKGILTSRGQTALELAREFKPAGILLDISLPDIDGWKVLERLKADLSTRHIPVFVISVAEEPETGLKQGAILYTHKPISREDLEGILAKIQTFRDEPRDILVIEDDENQRNAMLELIGNGTAKITAVGTGEEARNAMKEREFACVVLDLMLPDISGFDLIEEIRKGNPNLPILVYTGKELSKEEEERLNRVAQTVIVKDVRSPERLYDQTAFWIHRDIEKLPEDKRALIHRLHRAADVLAGKRVLLVDDDVRNIFAMTSVLERYGMEVVAAERGQEALDILATSDSIDIALMDIMLPEMDGYQVMREIRNMFDYRELPIIALTAKAMKGDREKCIEAGASDYIAKPVDTEKLLSMLRMWLLR